MRSFILLCFIETSVISFQNIHQNSIKIYESKTYSLHDDSLDSRIVRNFWSHDKTYNHNHIFETRNVEGLHDGMKMHKIPSTDILVSELCLGTMNFGQQVSKDEAYQQLDMATQKYGINFVDTSELFPGPYMESTMYRSERILGHWMKERGISRDKIVISTKIEGFDILEDFYKVEDNRLRDLHGDYLPYYKTFNKKHFIESIDKQLKRLGTDYIDVLHFASPERMNRLPGDRGTWRIEHENPFWNLTVTQQQLETMDELIRIGKIRCYGLTDETSFGVSNFVLSAHYLNLPKPVLVQNSYNLLERSEFESGLLEVCQPSMCNIGLMAKSPLAGGALTGKYLDTTQPMDTSFRMRKFPGSWMGRYIMPSAITATQKYQEMCDELSIPLGAAALSYVQSRDFVTSTIIGATSLSQLEDNILSLNVPLTETLEERIERIHSENWDPTRGKFDYMDPSVDYTDPSTLPWGSKDQDVDPELEDLLNQGERYIDSASASNTKSKM